MRYQHCALALVVYFGLHGAGSALAADRALVIGVNKFPGIIANHKPGGRNLSGAVADAQTFQDLLVKVFGFKADDIELLTDGEATREKVLGEFQTWLIDGSKPGDRVVFYYAGHGARTLVQDGKGGKRLTSTIVPSDAKGDLDDASPSVDGMIRGDEIGALLGKIADRQVLVVADSCFSGSVSRGGDQLIWSAGMRTLSPDRPLNLDVPPTVELRSAAKLSGGFLDVLNSSPSARTLVIVKKATSSGASVAVGPNVVGDKPDPKGSLAVWSAATLAQVTFDDPEVPGGVFTQSFAARLRMSLADPSGKDLVTAGSLLAYVRSEAGRFCKGFGAACADGLEPTLQAPDEYLLQVLAPASQSPAPQPPVPQVPAEPPVQVVTQESAPVEPTVPVEPPAPAEPPAQEAPKYVAELAAQVFEHANDFDLGAAILPGPKLKLGQEVRFRFRSAEPGNLVVLDSGPDGYLRQIFPNKYSEINAKGGRIHAKVDITIPDATFGFAFRAHDPGDGQLLVLVAEPDVDLTGLVSQQLKFEPIADPKSLLSKLAAKLLAPKLTADPDKPNGAHRWAFVTVPYSISN